MANLSTTNFLKKQNIVIDKKTVSFEDKTPTIVRLDDDEDVEETESALDDEIQDELNELNENK